MKLKLSKDAKHWWKLWSVWCSFAALLLTGFEMSAQAGLSIAPLWREIIGEESYLKVMASLMTLSMATRFIRQTCISVKENSDVEESDSPAS